MNATALSTSAEFGLLPRSVAVAKNNDVDVFADIPVVKGCITLKKPAPLLLKEPTSGQRSISKFFIAH
jgi:hypothetical protein